jgi:hypothetical protein
MDLKKPETGLLFDAAWELYRTGAIYGIDDYSMDAALSLALDAVTMELSLRRPSEVDKSAPLQESEPPSTAEPLVASESA